LYEIFNRTYGVIRQDRGSWNRSSRSYGEMAVLTGSAPVSTLRDYQTEVTAYTRGSGHLFCTLKGYEPCHNGAEVIAAIGYEAEGDLENPTGSVFCAHGAGFVVPWDQVEDYMHLDSVEKIFQNSQDVDNLEKSGEDRDGRLPGQNGNQGGYRGYGADIQDDKELYEIFNRTYGVIRQDRGSWNRSSRSYGEAGTARPAAPREKKDEYLLVDGYNIIFAWEELKELSKVSLDAARTKLADILCNYQGYRKMHLILVFDAYKVQEGIGEIQQYHNIHIVYTKEAETADQYIEKTVHRIGKSQDVTVATSDAAEQVIIWGQGARRMSARELKKEIQTTCLEIQNQYLIHHPGGKNYLFENLSDDLAAFMEEVRLGKKSFED
ncbi:MAG: NYN domain-containing protein, partial [Lachnospiraceae bacterium]|nr:NYN domain-containing protein [Lachnospiraceae bacterium]